jgi:hypothetical protein
MGVGEALSSAQKCRPFDTDKEVKLIASETIPSEMRAVVLEKPGVLAHTTIPIWPVEEYGDSDFVLVKVAAKRALHRLRHKGH